MSLLKKLLRAPAKLDFVGRGLHQVSPVFDVFHPGGALNAKISSGAPINARNVMDPNGWVVPQPPTPEAPPAPLPPLVAGAPSTLPPGLLQRQIPYSQPTTGGPLTNLAYRMAGAPGGPQGITPQSPPQPNLSHDIGLQPQPGRMQANGLPMLDPLMLARLGVY